MQPASGTLYVVATPIGNLADISERALRVLGDVALIAAEDTRHSKALLQHFGIRGELVSLHEHNEQQRIDALIAQMREGRDIALISDAGTPLLSDPGFLLVRAARAAGLAVTPVPGASAITAALSAAGLPTDTFVFGGFLPAKAAARRQRLLEFGQFGGTVVVFESTHRIVDALRDIVETLGAEQSLVLARELTKRFETFISGSAQDVLQQLLQNDEQRRGEFVLLFNLQKQHEPDKPALQHCLAVLLEELPLKQAAALAAKICGEPKNAAYQLALEIKKG